MNAWSPQATEANGQANTSMMALRFTRWPPHNSVAINPCLRRLETDLQHDIPSCSKPLPSCSKLLQLSLQLLPSVMIFVMLMEKGHAQFMAMNLGH